MKIGIITHYYQSQNYGGNLQAYALCRFLNKRHSTEQICYVHRSLKRKMLKKCYKLPIKAMSLLKRKLTFLLTKRETKKIAFALEQRRERLLAFNCSIPHSLIIYNEETICEAEKVYDLFITGSDQVWHPAAVNDAYLLNFVKDKPKISYAASLAVDSLTKEYSESLHTSLENFRAISVRERNAVELLCALTSKSVEWVLDPVFFLAKEEWEEIIPVRQIKEKYLFCYFLGNNKKIRELARLYAEKHVLKIVTLPHLNGNYNRADEGFGDVQLYDVAPADFLSLIKNAEYIFTDSFHAVAFSLIFKKQYFVFNRDASRKMNSRIYSLGELFGTENRFFKNKIEMNVQYLECINEIDYDQEKKGFDELLERSIRFIERGLSN